MLSPEQVIPFLGHPEAHVREHALRYLAAAHDPGPATADDVWRAIDRCGPDARPRLMCHLEDFRQTDAALDRLLAELRVGPEERERYHLLKTLCGLDYDLLTRRGEQIRATQQVVPHVREHLAERLRLVGEPPESLWELLLARASEVADKDAMTFDMRPSERLTEALARHPEAVAERVLTLLRDDSVTDWRETFCVELVGRMRWRPAIDLLLDKLTIEADILPGYVMDALVRIGAPEVLRAIEARYAQESNCFRMDAAGTVERIKRPESEELLLRLLPGEDDPAVLTCLAGGLCGLCTTHGLEQVRQIIISGRYDAQFDDLEVRLLTVGTMVGYEPPEAATWRAALPERLARAKEGEDAFERLLGAEARQRWLEGKPPWPERDSDWEPAEDEDDGLEDDALEDDDAEDYAADVPALDAPFVGEVETIRRATPKVGRNDPCPCGSGRKYKKCCLRADEG